MENTNIEIKTEEKKKKAVPKTCPLKHSNFFLTINSQKNVNSFSIDEKQPFIDKFTEVTREFYNNDIQKFIVVEGSKIGEKYNMPRNLSRDELIKRITNVKVEFVIEIGPESYKLHNHGMICITKRGLDTKLDYTAIVKYFNEKLGYEIHFNSQLFRDAKADLSHYMEKAPVV